MKKKFTIPTIIGLFVLIVGIGIGVFLVERSQVFRLGAQAEKAPKNIRVTNITDSSFTVSWTTDKEYVGYIIWGESNSSINKTVSFEENKPTTTNLVTINNLNPLTNYYFKINSGGVEFDNSGIPWSVTTAPKIDSIPSTQVISGTILTASGQPAANVLVYATAAGGSPLVTKTSSNGSWVIPISTSRTYPDLSSYLPISAKDPTINIFVQGGPRGIASAQVFLESASPAPSITLGQTYDFRNEENSLELPKASLELPQSTSSPRITSTTGTDKFPTTVSLISIKEKESITTTKPEFFGQGPPGTTITIKLESEPIIKTLTIGSSGSWQWSPPSDLTEGEHTITISWRDSSGILRTITRSFTVLAAEGPAFESSPSATTPTPTPTPTKTPTSTPTPKPTSTPTPTRPITPTASPSPTPRVSLPSTTSGIPTAGDLTPTIALLMMSLGLISTSFIIWKKGAN